MPDGGGGSALAAQQAAAVNIVPKNIAENDPTMFANAFFKATDINRRTEQLENQLQIAYLKNAEASRYHDMQMDARSRDFALKEMGLNLRAYAAENSANNAANRLALMRDGLDLKNEVQDFKLQKDKETMEGTSALMTSLSTLDRSDPKFYEKITSIYANPTVARAVNTPLGRQMIKEKKEEFNLATRRLVDVNNAKWRGFNTEVKNTFDGLDAGIFANPSWWQDDPNNPKQKFYMWKDANNQPHYTTRPASLVNRNIKRFSALTNEQSQIPQQINDDDVRAAPAGSTSPTMSAEQQKMLDWARRNPGDPRSQQIKDKLGVSE